jgi:hypothetical protein
MTDERRIGALEALLEQAAEAHHAYERDELEGVFDEQWPAWYGAWIVEHGLGEIVERDVSASEAGEALTRAWAALQGIDPKPAEPWAAWTARHIAADL